ncbi:hypothetical protein ACJMK2_001319 [Sinanodonta woodiana]|uniref:Acyl-coenzyme A oxidase n=1 Tax=Sinanodonta woodiana TaxID=1069815 RepID=A0ABD3XTL0_SINWO
MAVNPDLARERKQATFDVEKLTEFIYNGGNIVRRRRYLQNIIFNDKYLSSFKPWAYRTREEEYEIGLAKNVYLNKLMNDLNITNAYEQFFIREAAVSQESNPLGLHVVMFIPTIEKQGTKEQVNKWIPLAKSYKIIGTYAQTELGHGTFLRGLETTATFDPATDEFVINCPTLTSMKYWPGALGKTCNAAVTMAQLHINGKNYGMHAFMTPLRDFETHQPLPGIVIGDIGPKFGYGGNDNGFLLFKNYRIPRDHMLMRYAKVERDGTYTSPPSAKLAYAPMIHVRSLIVGDAARCLAQAAVIATRYSAVRRQSEMKPGEGESQVIDYQTQQEKLFPQIANSYALLFVSRYMLDTYLNITQQIEQGKTDELPQLHAIASGMKAVSSWLASEGVDNLRMACGGHGYSHASGIPKIFINLTPACTYEGENTVMVLQSARYLVKCVSMLQRGETLPGFMTYLSKARGSKSPLDDRLQFSDLVDAYEQRAARMVKSSAMRLQSLIASGKSPEVSWNMTSVQLTKAAMAHVEAFIVKTFVEVVSTIADKNVRAAMESLCRLYAVHGMNKKMGDFLKDSYISGAQADMLMNKMLDLFQEIRPNAVALVDAYDYHDNTLQSCIGRYDGKVYEALYEYSKNSPLNEKEVLDSYYKLLRPVMKGEYSIPPVAKL